MTKKRFKKISFLVNDLNFLNSHRGNLVAAAAKNSELVDIVSPANSEAARFSGVRYVSLNLNRTGLSLFGLLKTQLRAWKYVFTNSSAIFHVVTIIPILFFGLPLLMLRRSCVYAVTGMGTVFTSNQTRLGRLRESLIRIYYRKIFNGKNARVIVQNSDDYAFLTNVIRVNSSNISVIKGSGVDTRVFEFSDKLRLAATPTILVPARLIKEKGIIDAVCASEILNSRGIKHEFCFAGDVHANNPTSLSMEDIEMLKRKSQSVRFIGYQANMSELLRKCDLVCFPSYREGLPKAIIEAFAVGRLCIGYDAIGVREIIHHKKNGLLVKYKNVQSLADMLQNAIEHYDTYKELIIKARVDVEENFTIEKITNLHLDIYRDLDAVSPNRQN
jgi:glycosyltransferase involved in cell wall biosynthesis